MSLCNVASGRGSRITQPRCFKQLLVFLCERHDRLTGNINFQDNLLNVLLTRSLPLKMSAPAP